MAKGNTAIRNRFIGGMNWWKYAEMKTKHPKGFRNEPLYLDEDDIIYRTKAVEQVEKEQKLRKRQDRKAVNCAKFNRKNKLRTERQRQKDIDKQINKISRQIENGYIVAKSLMEDVQNAENN